MINIDQIKFNSEGLVPVITQDAVTGEVLMQAYMNREALEISLGEMRMCYYSRSRKCLWRKGGTSGHFQSITGAYADCDFDSILFRVLQTGAACHTGRHSCFFNELAEDTFHNYKILFDIAETVRERKREPKENSYTNYLFYKGTDKICKKIGEEAAEVIIAAKNKDKTELANELADLFYHIIVLAENENLDLNDIFSVLFGREGKPADAKYKGKV
ncbi:MAG: bifunctional phosphoribosyl-AMP cyclohydrolase/phosphoribosyl-ATP diphosphatase HisIE [Clostridiales bacterium]|jgi:phosphoribosyl-ATP pyrophosphohydrolase/phosphoribosyl-AMP cyclohydrolase|nr:bifunctional phosphoribosyl-AMP cyclohydrolase/phosphoribosyl-ATP diphosphatase HisIE [Clostridiales bacterium]